MLAHRWLCVWVVIPELLDSKSGLCRPVVVYLEVNRKFKSRILVILSWIHLATQEQWPSEYFFLPLFLIRSHQNQLEVMQLTHHEEFGHGWMLWEADIQETDDSTPSLLVLSLLLGTLCPFWPAVTSDWSPNSGKLLLLAALGLPDIHLRLDVPCLTPGIPLQAMTCPLAPVLPKGWRETSLCPLVLPSSASYSPAYFWLWPCFYQ